jgi:hypothetical protein
VAYGIGNSQTGRLTVPARGSVALSVNYGPSMPFTATRSGTTATATLAYSYPLVVGDQITVTGASNTEWNTTYTIASVVSGTSVTFTVPSSHSATAGTGATMQTTGTAVLTAAAIRAELATELGRMDQNISSRLASADYTTPPTTAQISAAVEGSLLDENDGQAVLNAIVGAIGNQNVNEVALVAAIRSDLERSGGKLDSIPTDAAPSAASVASAVWSAATKEITGGTVDTLTNSPDVPTESEIAAQVRTELSVELGRIDQAISSRLASADYTAPSTPPTASAIADEVRVELATELANLDAPVSGATAPSAATVASQVRTELTAELAKVSSLNTERLANVATTAIVGNLLAQAQS